MILTVWYLIGFFLSLCIYYFSDDQITIGDLVKSSFLAILGPIILLGIILFQTVSWLIKNEDYILIERKKDNDSGRST